MDQYIVIGYHTRDSWSIGPFAVHRAKGETIKDVQDKIAAQAEAKPEIIYTVVLEDDYRQVYRDMLAKWLPTDRIVDLEV